MGPPISTWPYSHPVANKQTDKVSEDGTFKKCYIQKIVESFRVICLNFTFALLLLQVFVGLSSVMAGPVIFNMDYLQGPVPLARNIRHLPCISRRTSQEGLCMFAIDCLKANGSHLGTCIDRFYFGSCCQIPDKTILPQIIGNHIDDNSIDSGNFVHPQTEDKIQEAVNKIPDTIFPTRKPTTEKVVTERTTTTAKPETLYLETKSDELTTVDNKLGDDTKLTTAVVVETTTKQEINTSAGTEMPVKLSTFQSVSGENPITEKTEVETTKLTTTAKPTRPTRLPVRPTFTRPTYKPYNYTRPQYTQSTFKPKPTKPASVYNTTRKPPYRNPPKRPSTKKPLPIPPRLNITILPQSTSSKPVFTRPSSVSIIYINNTVTTSDRISTTKAPLATSTTTTEATPVPTEKEVLTTEVVTVQSSETTVKPDKLTTIADSAALETVVTEPEKELTLQEIVTESLKPMKDVEISETPTVPPQSSTLSIAIPASSSETPIETIENEESTSKPILSSEKPLPSSDTPLSSSETPLSSSEAPQSSSETPEISSETVEASPDIPTGTVSSTEFPPLVTWTNTVDAVTKGPENVTEATEDTWSPITPPEGWVLITKPPEPEPSTSTTTSTPITTTTTEKQSPTTEKLTTTTEKLTPTTEKLTTTTEKLTTTTEKLTTTTQKPTTSTEKLTTTSEKATTETTQSPTLSTQLPTQGSTTPFEFTVNVTLTPKIPTSTPSDGLTTVSSENGTDVNKTESAEGIKPDADKVPSTTPVTVETTTESVNMSDFKDVCGRRLWQAPQARIVGGEKSGFGMWPWQISLRQYRTSTYLHKCGAALLNENWAITAAHCVEHVPPSELLVRLGEHDLANEDEPYGFAERRVQIVASHPNFDPATFEYDLALLRFYEPVKFQPNILPVCVPDSDEDYVGKTAYVTGWGRLYDGIQIFIARQFYGIPFNLPPFEGCPFRTKGPLPSVLQEVKVPVINNTACEAMYQAAGYNEHIPNIFICAGRSKGGADSCEGDSGGPMVIRRERDNRFVLGGIISWGIGCAEPNQPGVYTRISEFRDWINQILQF